MKNADNRNENIIFTLQKEQVNGHTISKSRYNQAFSADQ